MTDPDPTTMTDIPKSTKNDFQMEVSDGKALRLEDAKNAALLGTADAARSVLTTVDNQTGRDLSRQNEHLDHGIWTENEYPPEIISANSTQQYQAESQGFMTGTEGYSLYKIDDGLTVKFYFDNPYIGANGYKVNLEGQGTADYEGSFNGGGGNNASVTYTLKFKG